MRTRLLGMSPARLKEIALENGLPSFTGNQIARWMYKGRARSIDDMTNISKEGRARLAENYEVGIAEPSEVQTSRDGTRKYLFPVPGSDRAVEAVMIPDGDRKTLCVSSQNGCRMGCRFCMTGRGGYHGQLQVADILSQFLAVEEAGELTNAVFMGMGEPLDNWDNVNAALEVLTSDWGFGWSPKRITVSTIGVIPSLKNFLDGSRCHLAVSLHSPFADERASIMPMQKAWPLNDVLDLVKSYDFTGQRRVSFEYTMFSGLNDSPRHADALASLLKGLECRVNLIRFHKIPDFPWSTSAPERMDAFKERLEHQGITVTIRASRGEDILAACGLLAGSRNKLPEER